MLKSEQGNASEVRAPVATAPTSVSAETIAKRAARPRIVVPQGVYDCYVQVFAPARMSQVKPRVHGTDNCWPLNDVAWKRRVSRAMLTAKLPYLSLATSVAAKSSQSGLSIASAGVGTPSEFAGEFLRVATQGNVTQRPYKGARRQ
jgi:hypothetical protein